MKRLAGLRYLIIDEYSMVVAKMLSIIFKRLRQVTGKHEQLFGGINVILVGDTKQLSPVKDTPLWSQISQGLNETSKEGLLAFSQFEKVIILHQIVRQEGTKQKIFREVLLRLHIGMSKAADYEYLSTRS